MGFEKAILYKKEHRKPYRGAKAIDRHCRNHGSCDWCRGDRLHNVKKRLQEVREREKDEDYKDV